MFRNNVWLWQIKNVVIWEKINFYSTAENLKTLFNRNVFKFLSLYSKTDSRIVSETLSKIINALKCIVLILGNDGLVVAVTKFSDSSVWFFFYYVFVFNNLLKKSILDIFIATQYTFFKNEFIKMFIVLLTFTGRCKMILWRKMHRVTDGVIISNRWFFPYF